MDYNALKYIITVDNYQSISRAAEELFLSQPNISKVIQNVEKEVGFPIFYRTAKGVITTPRGKEFLKRANTLINEFDIFTNDFVETNVKNFIFNISYPRATYIANSVAEYINTLETKDRLNISLYESNSADTINAVIKDAVSVGIIRFNETESAYLQHYLQLQNIDIDIYFKYQMGVLVSKESPLAKLSKVSKKDLQDYIGIVHQNPEILDTQFANENYIFNKKAIKVLERGSQLILLSKIPNSYIFVSPVNKDFLERFGYVFIPYDIKYNNWNDAIIHKHSHTLNDNELKLIETIKKNTKELH